MSTQSHAAGGAGSSSRPEISGRPPGDRANAAQTPARSESGPHHKTKSRLWLWFVAAFLIQGAAWTAWFIIASQHKVAEVPLAHTHK